MARLPERLKDLQPRLPEQGLIKYGERGANGLPKAIPWFRFCARPTERDALAWLAEKYGGEVLPWKNGYDRDWLQVRTEASEIEVKVPPDALGDGPVYELWNRGGKLRSCDGEVCTIPRGMAGDPNPEPIECPCICGANEKLQCKPHTRLRVVLAGLPTFVGYWRLECKGNKAMHELPGMVQLLADLIGKKRIAHGLLRLERRDKRAYDEATKKNGTHTYITPVLGLPMSFDALLSGEGAARALGPADGGRLALPAGELRRPSDENIADHDWVDLRDGRVVSGAEWNAASEDDDITDAEVVEDAMSDLDRGDVGVGREAGQRLQGDSEGRGDTETLGAEREEPDAPAARNRVPAPTPPPGFEDPDTTEQVVEDEMKFLRQRCAMAVPDAETRHAMVRWVSKGRTATSTELRLEELRRLRDGCEKVRKGELLVTVVDGEATFEKAAS